jgi:hypothetical protein
MSDYETTQQAIIDIFNKEKELFLAGAAPFAIGEKEEDLVRDTPDFIDKYITAGSCQQRAPYKEMLDSIAAISRMVKIRKKRTFLHYVADSVSRCESIVEKQKAKKDELEEKLES